MKTRAEVNELKENWQVDPCWDLEDTEGFEDYRKELAAFRLSYEYELGKTSLVKDLEEKIKAKETEINDLRRLVRILKESRFNDKTEGDL